MYAITKWSRQVTKWQEKKGAGARGFGYWGEAPAVVTGMYLSNARTGVKVTAEKVIF
jgi:hypothetical protein